VARSVGFPRKPSITFSFLHIFAKCFFLLISLHCTEQL
jgi:hypothetical protein